MWNTSEKHELLAESRIEAGNIAGILARLISEHGEDPAGR